MNGKWEPLHALKDKETALRQVWSATTGIPFVSLTEDDGLLPHKYRVWFHVSELQGYESRADDFSFVVNEVKKIAESLGFQVEAQGSVIKPGVTEIHFVTRNRPIDEVVAGLTLRIVTEILFMRREDGDKPNERA